MKLGMRRGRVGWLLLLLLCACGRGKGDAGKAAASASSVPASSAVPVVSAPPSARPPPPPVPVCRAIQVQGVAKMGESTLTSGEVLDGETWVSLEKGATVALKHSATGRELSITGPALFRACRRGREQLLLVSGSVTAVSGMGSRPGAEVVIATPIAGVHYGDAEYTLTLDDKKLAIAVRAGQVELEPQPAKAKKPEKATLLAKDKLSLPFGKPDPKVLMSSCQEAAEAAEASARRVGDRSAPEPLGERAQAHVKARKLARNACTVAAAATGLVADPEARAGLWAEAVRWEGLWESIPRRGLSQPAEK